MLYRAHNAVQALAVAVRAVFCPTLHSLFLVGSGFWSAGASYPWRLDYRVSCASGYVYCPCSGSAWLELRILFCRTLVSHIVDFLSDRHYFCPDRYMLRDFSSPYPCGLTIRVSRLSGAVY